MIAIEGKNNNKQHNNKKTYINTQKKGKKNTYQLNMNVDIQLFSTQTNCMMCEKEGVEQQKEGWG